MKQAEIRSCLACKKPPAHDNTITFYRVSVEQLVVNVGAVQRQTGLEMMLGNARIAAAMGADEDIAVAVEDPLAGLVCLECATRLPLAALLEVAAESTVDKAVDLVESDVAT